MAFRISAHVDKQDYDIMLPLLQERIQAHGKVKVYAEVQDVQEYSLQALRDEVTFDLKHANDFSRVAIVGNQKWLDWLVTVAKPFTTADVRYFDFSERSQAWEWIHTS